MQTTNKRSHTELIVDALAPLAVIVKAICALILAFSGTR